MKIAAPLKNQIFLFVLLLTSYFLLLTSPASAQSQANPYTVPNTTSDVPKNLHTWTQNVMIEVMAAMSCQLSGIDPTNPKSKCLGVDSKTGKIGFVQGGGGAIGVTGKMIAMLYTPPLHTADYFKYLANNFGIAKPAHAQAAGGFEGLKPVQSLWVAFRNIVYLLFVIVFVVIGLAIMLRVRIDPRTVMTIQNQIPKIIIGILLVTFSFAIAGFLIDLMYTVIFLSYELISGAVPSISFSGLNPLEIGTQTPLGLANHIKAGGVFGIAHSGAVAVKDSIQSLLNIGGCGSITDCLVNIFNPFKIFWDIADVVKGKANAANWIIDTISYIAGSTMYFKVASMSLDFKTSIPLIDAVITFIKTSGQQAAAIAAGLAMFSFAEWSLRIGLPYLIAYFVIFIALLIALIRLWFLLIINYVLILLDVVFAPFWIAAALLPGSPIGFTAWLRSIIANLAAFPATILMFLLAKVFIDSFGASKASTDFVPPLVGGVPGTDMIGNLIGIGIILLTPNVVSMVKAALGVKGVGVGPMIVGALAGGMGAPGGILATTGHIGGTLFGISHLAGVIPGGERIPLLGRLRGQQGQQGQQRP